MSATVTIHELAEFETPAVETLALGYTLGHSFAGKRGRHAHVALADGTEQRLSRLTGETQWIVDGEWAPGRSFPRFWNGAGSRCTLLVVASPDVADALECEAGR